MEDKETVEVETQTDLRNWLEQNEGRKTGVWLATYKESSPKGRQLTFSQIVDELLCFGWIDSMTRRLDDHRSAIWISPRKPTSAWSKINKDKIAVLESEGRLRPSALSLIAHAKISGTWDKLNDVEAGIVPPDLAAELDRYPEARSNFDAFPRSVKRSILEWIIQAKTEATRNKRIFETAEKASQNIRANQWKPKEN